MLLRLALLLHVARAGFSRQGLGGVVFQQETVDCHPLDHRAYSGLRLSNGLRVLLVSDPTAAQAAATLVVNTGGMDDPEEMPGLAHFVEHAILLGSRRFPRADHFRQFLAVNGGAQQGKTNFENTMYEFAVGHWALEGALEMFAEFFIAPAFDETSVLREAQAIDSEYALHQMPSEVAFDKAAFAALATNHSFSKFIVGNYDTLVTLPQAQGIPVLRRLVAHYKQHYSANTMQLVVVGREPLDELTRMVVPRFSRVPNRNITRPPMGSPFANLPLEIRIDPFQTRKLMVQFALAAAPYSHVQTQLGFVAYLFNLDGQGSLADALRSRGFARRVDACVKENVEGFVIFSVDVYATDQGHAQKHRILAMVFAYLGAVETQATAEMYQAYLAQITSHAHGQAASHLASHLAAALFQGARFDNVLLPYAQEFDGQLFQRALASFSTFNFILYDVKPVGGESAREPWLGARYATSQFNASFLLELDQAMTRASPFVLPLESQAARRTGAAMLGKAKIRQLNSRVWSVNDASVAPTVRIELALAIAPSLESNVCMALLAAMLGMSVGNGAHITTAGNSIVLELQADQETILREVSLLAARLTRVPTAAGLGAATRVVAGARDAIPKPAPLALAKLQLGKILDPFYWSPGQIASVINKTSLSDFQPFVEALPISLHCHVLSLGNFSDAGLLDLERTLLPVARGDGPAIPPPRFSPARSVYAGRTRDKRQVATLYYLHLYDAGDVEGYALAYATKLLSAAQFYHRLRTTEQLSYIVESRFHTASTGGGIIFAAKSRQPGAHVASRIEAFFTAFVAYIQATPEATLAPVLQGIARVLENSPTDAPTLLAKHWEQILSRTYRFDRGNPFYKLV